MKKIVFLLIFLLSAIMLTTFLAGRFIADHTKFVRPEAPAMCDEELSDEPEGASGSEPMLILSSEERPSIFKRVLSYIKEILSVLSMLSSLILFIREMKRKKIAT